MAKIKLSFENVIKNHKHYIELGMRKDLPVQVSFQYSKLLKQINEEIIEIEKARSAIVSRYELDKAENHADPEINRKADEEWDKFIKENFIKIDFEPISIKSLTNLKEGITSAMFNGMSDFFTD